MSDYEQVRREQRERRKAAVFTYRDWYVIPGADGRFEVLEENGDYADDAKTLALAKTKCVIGADEAVRCRLRDAIMETSLDDRDEATLRAILGLLGRNPDKI